MALRPIGRARSAGGGHAEADGFMNRGTARRLLRVARYRSLSAGSSAGWGFEQGAPGGRSLKIEIQKCARSRLGKRSTSDTLGSIVNPILSPPGAPACALPTPVPPVAAHGGRSHRRTAGSVVAPTASSAAPSLLRAPPSAFRVCSARLHSRRAIWNSSLPACATFHRARQMTHNLELFSSRMCNIPTAPRRMTHNLGIFRPRMCNISAVHAE